MNWLDYALIASMVIGVAFGILTGPFWQIYRVFSVILSIAVTFLLNKIISAILGGFFGREHSYVLGYIIVFVVVLILTYVIGMLLKPFLTKMTFGVSGRILGGGIGFLKTFLICGIIIIIVSFMGKGRTQEVIKDSLIANNIEKGARVIISRVP